MQFKDITRSSSEKPFERLLIYKFNHNLRRIEVGLNYLLFFLVDQLIHKLNTIWNLRRVLFLKKYIEFKELISSIPLDFNSCRRLTFLVDITPSAVTSITWINRSNKILQLASFYIHFLFANHLQNWIHIGVDIIIKLLEDQIHFDPEIQNPYPIMEIITTNNQEIQFSRGCTS